LLDCTGLSVYSGVFRVLKFELEVELCEGKLVPNWCTDDVNPLLSSIVHVATLHAKSFADVHMYCGDPYIHVAAVHMKTFSLITMYTCDAYVQSTRVASAHVKSFVAIYMYSCDMYIL